MCLRRVSAAEIPVHQVVLPPLLDGIQAPCWGRRTLSVGGGLGMEWMGGCYIAKCRDLAL